MPPPLYRPPAPHDWKLIQVEVGQLIKSTAAGLSHERASDRLGTVPWAFVATPAAASAASAADAALPPPVVPTLAANNASLPSSQGSPSPPLRAPPRAPRPRVRPPTRIAVSGSSALSELFVLEPAAAPARPAQAAAAVANGHAPPDAGGANGNPASSGSPAGGGGGGDGSGGGGAGYPDDLPSMTRLGRLSLFAVAPDERVSAPVVTAVAAAAANSPTALVGLASGAVAHVEVRTAHLGSMVFAHRPSREEARQMSTASLLGLFCVPPQGSAAATAATATGVAAAGGSPVPLAAGISDGGGNGDAVTALVGIGGSAFASGHRSGAVRLWSGAYAAAPPVGAAGVWHRVHRAVATDGVAGRVYQSSPVRTAAALSSAVMCLTAVAWPLGAGTTAILLAAGTEDGTLVVLHPERPDVSPLLLHGSDCGPVSAVVFCGDASGVPTEDVTVASGGEDDMVHVHVVPASRLLPPPLGAAPLVSLPSLGRRREPRRHSLAGHAGFVTGLAWYPPAAALLSSGLDGALLAWHRAPCAGGAPAEWVPTPTVLPLPSLGPLLSVAVVPRAEGDGGITAPTTAAARPGASPLTLAASQLPLPSPACPDPPPPSPAELYVASVFDDVGRVNLHRFAVETALRPLQPPDPATQDVLMVPEADAVPPE